MQRKTRDHPPGKRAMHVSQRVEEPLSASVVQLARMLQDQQQMQPRLSAAAATTTTTTTNVKHTSGKQKFSSSSSSPYRSGNTSTRAFKIGRSAARNNTGKIPRGTADEDTRITAVLSNTKQAPPRAAGTGAPAIYELQSAGRQDVKFK
jgi:hypothetical protein